MFNAVLTALEGTDQAPLRRRALFMVLGDVPPSESPSIQAVLFAAAGNLDQDVRAPLAERICRMCASLRSAFVPVNGGGLQAADMRAIEMVPSYLPNLCRWSIEERRWRLVPSSSLARIVTDPVDIALSGSVVRSCRACSRWFAPYRSDALVCSPSCRSTQSARERRARQRKDGKT